MAAADKPAMAMMDDVAADRPEMAMADDMAGLDLAADLWM